MRIFFVNRYFYPDHAATGQMLSDIAFALANRGHSITVVTSGLSYDGACRRYPRREKVAGVDVIRVAAARFGRRRLVGRAIDDLIFCIAAAWTLLLRVRWGDIVVSKTDPPLLLLATMPVTRLRGARAVHWLQDVFPEVATQLGLAQGRVWRATLSVLRWWRNRALRKASLNIAIGARMADVLCGLGVPDARIRIIPNWADGRRVRPIQPEENTLRKKWGLARAAFVVGYSGTLGRAHDVATLLQAMALTEGAALMHEGASGLTAGAWPSPILSGTPVSWLFVGGGVYFEQLRSESRRRGYLHVHFQPYQPRELLAESLSVPDMHIVSLRPALEGLVVPSKYYGVAAVGRPAIFIGDPEGEIGRILTETGTGFVVAEGDGAGLVAAIRRMAEAPRLKEGMGRRARALCEARYDVRFAIEAWSDVIRALRS